MGNFVPGKRHKRHFSIVDFFETFTVEASGFSDKTESIFTNSNKRNMFLHNEPIQTNA